jgi:Flp pilus assembly protein TadG
MIRRLGKILSRLKRDESGSPTVEFVLVFPVYISLLLISVELSFITMRHALLERGLDIAVREIRLSTLRTPDYQTIKRMVCDNALFIDNCNTNLRLEMKRTNIRSYTEMGTPVLCENAASPTSQDDLDNNFANNGLPNELMQIRACYRYSPMVPQGILANALTVDPVSGQASIVSTSAFVQEPL